MTRVFFHPRTPQWWRRASVPLLAISCCLGFLLGAAFASSAGHVLVPMMRRAVSIPVSITGLFAVAALPFLFSVFSVYFFKPWLLLPICLMKSFAFSFCATGVGLAFGSAAWLVRLLFLFSDCCVMMLLYVYWLRHISGARPHSCRETWAIIACCLMIGIADYRFVSPFLVGLTEY